MKQYVLVTYDQNHKGGTSWTLEAKDGMDAYKVASDHLLEQGFYLSQQAVFNNYQSLWLIFPCQGAINPPVSLTYKQWLDV
jgi:hypothetical protein